MRRDVSAAPGFRAPWRTLANPGRMLSYGQNRCSAGQCGGYRVFLSQWPLRCTDKDESAQLTSRRRKGVCQLKRPPTCAKPPKSGSPTRQQFPFADQCQPAWRLLSRFYRAEPVRKHGGMSVASQKKSAPYWRQQSSPSRRGRSQPIAGIRNEFGRITYSKHFTWKFLFLR